MIILFYFQDIKVRFQGVFTNHFYHLVGIGFLYSLITLCSPPAKRTSVLKPLTAVPDSAAPSAPSPVETDDSGGKEVSDIDEIIHRAREHCLMGEFLIADSLCREMLSILTNYEERSFGGDSLLSVDLIMENIVAIYSDLMPHTVSVPEEIASEVMHRRIFASLDSLEMSPQESILVCGYLKKTAILSDMPLVWNNRVLKAILYYLTVNRGTVESWKSRAPVYLSFMKKMFADSGLPQDLAYLPLIESGFNPRAYSRAHASGIWQFIESTGKIYGLRINYWVDERRDPVRSTKAAIRYLKKLYGDFGDWHLVLAAYNCGENALSRAIKVCGTGDYWKLELPSETMNYVPLYIASLAIAKSSEFTDEAQSTSDTVSYDTVSVHDCINMVDIAEGAGVDYDTLRKINPHILHWCTPPYMTDVTLYLPSGAGGAFRSFYSSLPEEKKVRWYRYMVQPGDNLLSIGRRFRTTVEAIRSVNRMKGTRITAGKYLFIPIPVDKAGNMITEYEEATAKRLSIVAGIPEGAHLTVYEVKPGETLWRLAEYFGVSAEKIRIWNDLTDENIKAGQILSIYTTGGKNVAQKGPDHELQESIPVQPDDAIVYIVSSGDNLFRIARNFSTTPQRIRELNGLSETSVIRCGDTLYIPKPSSLHTAKVSQSDKEIVYYRVKRGDNLWRIARLFGMSVETLCRYNDLSASAVISPGDTLRVLREGEM